ncbi:MAG: GAF domain-containing protein [Desulfopila sp.]
MSASNRLKEQDYLDVFQEVTRLISSVHDPQQVMDLVVTRLPVLLEVDAATIRLTDTVSGGFELGAASGLSEEYLSRATIDSKEVMAALQQGHPVARTDLDRHCDDGSSDYICREGVKSVMSLPILYKGENIGILRLLTKKARQFSDNEIGFAMSLAEQVGVAISKGRMFQEMENQLQFFNELRQISRLVNSTLDLETILQAIVNKLPHVMKVKGCTIRLLEPATNRLRLAGASGLSQRYLDRGSVGGEDSIFKALKGEPVAIYDAENDPRVNYHTAIHEEGIKSILAIPIKNDKEIIGVLRLLTDQYHQFSNAEIHFAVTAAEEGGNAIAKARLYRKITLLFNQIEEHERFLQTILDSLWLQLLVIDRDRRVIMVNKRFLELHTLSENEVLGRHYASVVSWSTKQQDISPVDWVFQEGRRKALVESPDNGEQGEQSRCYERQLFPIFDNDGAVDFVTEVVRDITDQKLLEKEKMERMKLEGVVEMAGTAAHDLNSPLFAALGTAQLLRDDLESAEMVAEVDTIISNLQKMGELTKEMTAVTGFESREYVGDKKIVRLRTKK